MVEKKVNIERHSRHILLKEIGGIGQQKIINSKIAIIGMGGLGAPCALYLAAAGVGKLILFDDDIIDISNLQRQILYKTPDIGASKVEIASRELSQIDDEVVIIAHNQKITQENLNLLDDADIIIDGCDNFKTRFLINKYCFENKKILISGAIGRFDGQIISFDFRDANSPCYQCLVPQEPENIADCAQNGVIGALVGIIGSTMALEAIKIITEAGDNLFGKLFIFDGLKCKSRVVSLAKDNECAICRQY